VFLCKKLKHAAMFGLDARIALAVLGVVSLSISLSQEKKSYKEQEIATKQEMRIFEAKFLKHWESLRFEGFYTTPADHTERYVTSTTTDYPDLPGDRAKRIYKTDAVIDNIIGAHDYTKPNTSDLYRLIVSNVDAFGIKAVSYNYIRKHAGKNYYISTGYRDYTVDDFMSRIAQTLSLFTKEDGKGVFIESDTFEPRQDYILSLGNKITAFNGDRLAMERDVKFYFILEHEYDPYSPSDYVLNVVMYSPGKNRVMDTTMPVTLQQLGDFTGPEGDDIFHIFNTKDVYLRAKAEQLRRLEEIKEKLTLVAETAYLDRITLCSTESTPSASCDLDSDGDYDIADKNALLDYNPFPKSSLDTSSAKYFIGSNAYLHTQNKGAETFLSGTLGLPEYYAYDLFGNILNYQSNVGLKTKGPYTVEVWY
jgi:hypothetical protein